MTENVSVIGGAPTQTIVPPFRMHASPVSISAARPAASNA
jgi:hypothetical protein